MTTANVGANVESLAEFERELAALLDSAESTCLWFLRPGYRPTSDEEVESVLRSIERHADRETFRRARRLREWLSAHSSVTSAAS